MDIDFIDTRQYHFIKPIKQSRYENQIIVIDKKTGKYEILYFWIHNHKKYQDYCPISQVYARLDHLKTNIPIVETFDHPVILKLKDHQIIDNQNHSVGCFLITKYPINGCISTLTNEYLRTNGKSNDKLNPTIRSKIIFGIASAMNYLHTKNIINNNTIYLDENFEPKIINDCLTKSLNNMNEKDPLYYRPVRSNFFGINNNATNNDYSHEKSSDVYSFGLFVYSMFSKNSDFSEKKTDFMPDCYWKLILRCWDQSFYERPKFNEIVEILKNEEFAIEEFGMKTDIDELHEYQKRLQKFNELVENNQNNQNNINQNQRISDNDDDYDYDIPIEW